MTNRTYRVTEIVGTSPEGIDAAIRNGVERAAKTLRHLDWFEVTQVRGQVKDGTVEHFQVGIKVGINAIDSQVPFGTGQGDRLFGCNVAKKGGYAGKVDHLGSLVTR